MSPAWGSAACQTSSGAPVGAGVVISSAEQVSDGRLANLNKAVHSSLSRVVVPSPAAAACLTRTTHQASIGDAREQTD